MTTTTTTTTTTTRKPKKTPATKTRARRRRCVYRPRARATRELASAITDAGAATHDALRLEKEELREARLRAAGGTADVREMEKQVRERIASVAESVDGLERGLSDLAKDEKTLRGVLEKRRAELERGEKRLGSLKAARPALRTSSTRSTRACRACTLSTWKSTATWRTWRRRSPAGARGRGGGGGEARRRAEGSARGRLREEEMRVLRGEEDVGDDFEDEFDDESEAGETFGSRGDASAKKKTASSHDAVSRRTGTGARHLLRRGPFSLVPRGASVRHRGRRRRGSSRGPGPRRRSAPVVGSVMGGRQRQRRRRRRLRRA